MSFPLIGNERVKEQICRAISQNRMPHAIILSGEAGQGKRTLAYFIASALVCSGEERPCGKCRNCEVTAAHSHPDIITVTRESGKKELRVDQIRAVRNDAYIKAHMANAKVFIIENADTMNNVSQNAFLKVLEEPPQNVHFILLCQNRDALLPTVLSRTVTFNITSPSVEEGVPVVASLLSCDSDRARELLYKTHGNIGAAVTLGGQKNSLAVSTVAEEFLDLVFEGNTYNMLKSLNPYLKDRVFMDEFFTELSRAIVQKIPTLSSGGRRAAVLGALYEKIKDYKKMLKTNANMPLLVTSMVADINEQLR